MNMRERAKRCVPWFSHKPTLLFPNLSQCYAICQVENIIVFSAPFCCEFHSARKARSHALDALHTREDLPMVVHIRQTNARYFRVRRCRCGAQSTCRDDSRFAGSRPAGSHKPRPRTYGSVRGANIADVVGATLHDGRNIVLRLCGRHRPGAPQQGGQGAFQGSVGRHELPRPLLRPLMAAKTAHRDGASQISWTRSDFDPSIEEPPGARDMRSDCWAA